MLLSCFTTFWCYRPSKVRLFCENEILLIQIIQQKLDSIWPRMASKTDFLDRQDHFQCKVWSWKLIERFRRGPLYVLSLYLVFTLDEVLNFGRQKQSTSISGLTHFLTRFSRILTIWTLPRSDTGPET